MAFKSWLMGGAMALTAFGAHARAEDRARFDIPPQSLETALKAFSVQSHQPLLFTPDLTNSKVSQGVSGAKDVGSALGRVLNGTGLTYKRSGDTFLIVRTAEAGRPVMQRTSAPLAAMEAASGSAPPDATVVQELVVTAQKREEAIQTVPIAISAFTQRTLEEQKIEGGYDLLKAIPNVTFSKNNFTGYNFSIRGIGTKAISATTDPGVAVSFNNASLIQNRLFEQEYFDVERVEVLRGPQGTLYGRNATAGVINVISAKADMSEFKGSLKGEVGNYHSKRISGMLNVPLVDDKLAIRFAGSLTNRQGYDFNEGTGRAVNGRDLWSARLTVAFNPTSKLRTSLVWERFNEDDNRSRTGKQLCKRDEGLEQVGSASVGYGPISRPIVAGMFLSQGCLPVSLYDDQAFQTPQGLMLPFVKAIIALGNNLSETGTPQTAFFELGLDAQGQARTLLNPINPYAGLTQSRDLRVIHSFRDPVYRAKADVVQFNFDFDLTSQLTLTAQTTYDKDQVYSFQDFNRFNTQPIIRDTSDLVYTRDRTQPSPWKDLAAGGIYCDPQLGCSNTIAGFDISTAKSTQWNQEIRLQSSFDGPLNFSVGANYTKFDVLADYYVFFNMISALAQIGPFNTQADLTKCGYSGPTLGELSPPVDMGSPEAGCPYIDPNPIESINGEGHNYFRSKNPYKLNSTAAFGELYWQATDALKVTAGLRYTDDHKRFIPVPSQALLGASILTGGDINRGFVEDPAIKQHWGEFTGRLGVDWKPKLSFTDQTMLYAFYSRGYKGGGANPPGIGYSKRTIAERFGIPPGQVPAWDKPWLMPIAQNILPTFKPEFVNAFEVGAKNTLLGGALTFNTDAFFYDYKDYQVSKVVDRSVSNENFDAHIWGLEFEAMFAPTRNLRLIGNLGYLDTHIGAGAQSIDIMNRTQSNPDWVLLTPWVQYPSNCIAPKAAVEASIIDRSGGVSPLFCGPVGLAIILGDPGPIDPATGKIYDPMYYDGTNGRPNINGGAGFMQNLEGNELPNSPHWTMNFGAQYSHEILEGWKATIRADGYWQSQSWARVYNAVNDKLHGWYNANLSLWVEKPEIGLKIEIYAKNVLDKTPITDSFINSDDTALTTNVFVLDPRLIGVSITKTF